MPTPEWKAKKLNNLELHFRKILKTLGYDLEDPNFTDSPKRVARVWFEELYKKEATKDLMATFPSVSDQLVLLKNHETWTRCPHHFESVQLKVSIAYLPNEKTKKCIGLSKLARIANFFSQGFVLQEDFTENLASGLFNALKARGVAVYVEGIHLCMRKRGIKSHNSITITNSLKGVFLEETAARLEFLTLVTK